MQSIYSSLYDTILYESYDNFEQTTFKQEVYDTVGTFATCSI